MDEIKGRTYSNGEKVETDGATFTDCRFERCSLRYHGGPHPQFNNCVFGEAGWHFSDGALRTIQLLQQMGSAEGGDQFIAAMFKPGFYIVEDGETA